MANSPNTPCTPYNLKANIYQFYEVVDIQKRIFKCKTCKIEYVSKTTSNLITHIGDHSAEKRKFLEMNESKPGPSTKKRKLFEVASQASTLNSNIIISNVSQNMKYSQGSPMFLSRMKALITMIINCMLPISLVSNVDFRAFLYVFDPYFVCPDVRTAKKKFLKHEIIWRSEVFVIF